MTDADILFSREGHWGVITLNRPKALNSLTLDMCVQMDQQLRAWTDDQDVVAILIEGAGEKAFCAGGDIRWLATTAKDDPAEAATFFRHEYRLNNLIASYPKPYIALMDGICMGGGVGVSAMADRRIATDRTLWAMPECGIGLMPDVGASHFLNQLDGGLAMYLGLTGARLKGFDCVDAGIATHFVPGNVLSDLRAQFVEADLSADALGAVDQVIGGLADTGESALAPIRSDIDKLFSDVASFDSLFSALEGAGAFGEQCLTQISGSSPTSLALTLKLLTDAPDNFSDCIAREFCVAAHLMEGPDFLEGVRAQIIDKDRNPQWSPKELAAVSDAYIERYFEIPEGGPLSFA